MRVFNVETGIAQVGIKAIDGVSQINAYTYVDPINIADANGPRKLRYGLMNLNLQLINVGGTARLEIYLPEAVDQRSRWYKYDSVNGWYEYLVDIVNDTYVLVITDGGFGDADSVAYGVIVDPIGLSGDSLTVDAGSVPSSVSGSGGGGGCFIQSAGGGSTTVGLLAALLVLGAVCGTGVVMRYRQAVVQSKTRF